MTKKWSRSISTPLIEQHTLDWHSHAEYYIKLLAGMELDAG